MRINLFVDFVDGCGGGTLLELADTVFDAAEAEEGDDADDAVGEDAKTEEDAEECSCGFGFAQGKESEEDAAHAEQQHEPPAVVAAFLIVDGEDGQ